jgi:hypothetical protein
MCDVTQILSQIEEGDGQAVEKSQPLGYKKLQTSKSEQIVCDLFGRGISSRFLESGLLFLSSENSQICSKASELWNLRGRFYVVSA